MRFSTLLLLSFAVTSCANATAGTLRLRHIESGGIGYSQGYTTLEGFFVGLRHCPGSWASFADLRGHLFDNGKWAANAGLGVRYIGTTRLLGLGGYYDLRKTSHRYYNQVSLGLETLGEIWDFRVNGYLPIGKKSANYGPIQFSHFSRHSAILSRKQEFAMKGANAEAAVHIDTFENAPLTLSFGSYYLQGQNQVAWGGEMRARADVYKYLRLEANTSYDNVFRWVGQGQIGINIPLGKRCQTDSASFSPLERLYQRTERREIIPVQQRHKKTKAIDPLTGLPYFFLFVDNTGHSDGSFESPYPDLVSAEHNSHQGDILFLFASDGAPYSVSHIHGFRMQNNQKIWGSGTSHTLATKHGPISIAPQTATRPIITNTGFDGSSVITLANNCEVAGIHIMGENIGYGIRGTGGVTNSVIQDNWIHISRRFAGHVYAIQLYSSEQAFIGNNTIANLYASRGDVFGIYAKNNNAHSQIVIEGNELSNFQTALGNMYGIYAYTGISGSPQFAIERNRVHNFDSRGTTNTMPAQNGGIIVKTAGNSQSFFSVSDNHISDFFAPSHFAEMGISIESTHASAAIVAITNNTIANFTATCDGIESSSFSTSHLHLLVQNNQVTQFPSVGQNGIDISSFNASSTCLTLTHNNASSKISLSQYDSSTFTLDTVSRGNAPSPTEAGVIEAGSCATALE